MANSSFVSTINMLHDYLVWRPERRLFPTLFVMLQILQRRGQKVTAKAKEHPFLWPGKKSSLGLHDQNVLVILLHEDLLYVET